MKKRSKLKLNRETIALLDGKLARAAGGNCTCGTCETCCPTCETCDCPTYYSCGVSCHCGTDTPSVCICV